ncbi:hypothetical protein BJV74DRAFT_797977 [Russula compacta]|nr:hypothetical protein BJV74DRAFT_797977 [Russula compacta]
MSQPQPSRAPTEVAPQEGSSGELDASTKNPKKPLPLRAVLMRPIQISITNHAMLALLGMAALVLIPLIWSTSVELGRLNLNPASIGLWMLTYGCMDGVLQITIAPHIIGRFGPQCVIITSIAIFAIIFVMFLLENLVVRRLVPSRGLTSAVLWLLILMQLASLSICNMGTASLFCVHPPFLPR